MVYHSDHVIGHRLESQSNNFYLQVVSYSNTNLFEKSEDDELSRWDFAMLPLISGSEARLRIIQRR